LGTGTNAAYVEDMSRMKKWKGGEIKSGKQVINTEWGAFDNEKKVLPLSKWDNQLDAAYVPGLQVYEKMISGRYLGEIMRYILLDLIGQGALFNGAVPDELRKEYEGFQTAYMSRIEADETENLDDIADLFTVQFGVHNTTLEERQTIKTIVHHLANRAARLVAAGIAAIFIMTEQMGGVVAVDGSMFEHYPNFPAMMQEGLRELLGGTLANRISLGMYLDPVAYHRAYQSRDPGCGPAGEEIPDTTDD
jgi:hexokinase